MAGCGLVLDACFEEHDTGPGHPERPQRVRMIRDTLGANGLTGQCTRIEPIEVSEKHLARVHDPDYILRVDRACRNGEPVMDSMDTRICRRSAEIARLAAGSLVRLCDRVAAGELSRGFAALRPPGHHAERAEAMGFCLFNNVAVAARFLRDEHDFARLLIVDWDVHHGNGTQHLFEDDPSVFYFSVHQSPLYPGTGRRSERGIGAGEGTTLNCPLAPGSRDSDFLRALEEELLPAAERFEPQFVLVSAGFDAHRDDPLAHLQVSVDGFARATRVVRTLANRFAEGRVVSVLEGGYHLGALAESVTAHLETMVSEEFS